MAKKHQGLGRGLNALIKDDIDTQADAAANTGVLYISADKIRKNPFQPRRLFEKDALEDLKRSISEHGVLQPLLVRTIPNGYELIAGERRLTAAVEAGLKDVPVIVMEAADNESLELALVENLQRENLNVLEEAEGYQALIAKFKMTQDQISERVGKARASVTNALRILNLPDEVKSMIASGALTAGHAKVLSGLEIAEEQIIYARKAANDNLSVRNLETLIRKNIRVPRKPRVSRDDMPKSHVAQLSDALHTHFGTAVRITPCRTYANGKKSKGSVEIDFYSNEDLDRILEILGVSLD